MDPVSHALFGRALVATVRTPTARLRGVAVAAVLGALSPDIDCVLMPVGWDIYLRVHSVGTHSLIGALAVGGLTSGVVLLLVRSSAFALLTAAAITGALSHLLLDVSCGAPLQLLWPFSTQEFALPLVAMADPWLLGMLVFATVAPTARRNTAGDARLLVAAVTLFLAAKGALLYVALHPARTTQPSGIVAASTVKARWGSLREWYVFDRTATRLLQWRITALGGPATTVISWPLAPESTLVRASRRLDTVRNFLDVHRFAFAREQVTDLDRRRVLWSDIRFCAPTAGGSGSGPTASAQLDCQLWVGGVFGRDGRVIVQQVLIGGFVQNRAPP
jgi:membrane-bound metal-dependent hydrolase YbcI (DUF457 family)